MARIAAVLAVAVLAAACGLSITTEPDTDTTPAADDVDDPPTQPEPPTGATLLASEEVDTLYRSGYSGIDAERRAVIATSDAWAAAWSELTGLVSPPPDLPQVDFATHGVLVLAMGGRPTGGYSIEIGELSHADRTLYAVVREVSPAATCLVTQATTQPAIAIAVPIVPDAVEFIEEQVVRDCT